MDSAQAAQVAQGPRGPRVSITHSDSDAQITIDNHSFQGIEFPICCKKCKNWISTAVVTVYWVDNLIRAGIFAINPQEALLPYCHECKKKTTKGVFQLDVKFEGQTCDGEPYKLLQVLTLPWIWYPKSTYSWHYQATSFAFGHKDEPTPAWIGVISIRTVVLDVNTAKLLDHDPTNYDQEIDTKRYGKLILNGESHILTQEHDFFPPKEDFVVNFFNGDRDSTYPNLPCPVSKGHNAFDKRINCQKCRGDIDDIPLHVDWIGNFLRIGIVERSGYEMTPFCHIDYDSDYCDADTFDACDTWTLEGVFKCQIHVESGTYNDGVPRSLLLDLELPWKYIPGDEDSELVRQFAWGTEKTSLRSEETECGAISIRTVVLDMSTASLLDYDPTNYNQPLNTKQYGKITVDEQH